MIRVEAVGKSFGGVKAVSDCSINVAKGSITGLIGPNGAGKTTLFNMIAGTIFPDSGKIYLAGDDVTLEPDFRRFHRGIARSFQIAQEFSHLTVLENLLTVPKRQTGEALMSALFRRARVRVEECKHIARARVVLEDLQLTHLQHQLAGQLSGGQKKLVELARIMMAEPKVVLLDEIGAGVNKALLKKIIVEIRRLNRQTGLTFLLIEHDMDLVSELCDPVIVMTEGRVLTKGRMVDIRNDHRVIEAYLGSAA